MSLVDTDVLEAQRTENDRLRRENEILRGVAATLHGWSRRYCDGRSTYAASDHNMATRTLLKLGVELYTDPISTTGPFAADGQFGLEARDRAAADELARLPQARELRTAIREFLEADDAFTGPGGEQHRARRLKCLGRLREIVRSKP